MYLYYNKKVVVSIEFVFLNKWYNLHFFHVLFFLNMVHITSARSTITNNYDFIFNNCNRYFI